MLLKSWIEMLKSSGGSVRKLEETIRVLSEKVGKLEEAVSKLGFKEVDKDVQVYESEEPPEEVKGKQPLECSSGSSVEVCVYDA